MKILLTAINSKYIHTGLGIRYVAEYARSHNFDVDILEDTINLQILQVLEKLMDKEYQVYGFEVHIWNREYVLRLARMVKALRPDATLVLGGPEVSFSAEAIFKELPELDYLVQGEGEICFTELLKYLETKTGPVPKHIAYRKQDDTIELNGGLAIIEDLGILPFPYPDLEEIKKQQRIVYYESTRGCPFNCSYCLSGISRNVRKRPLELVLADMDRFIASGVTLVKFVDRTYNLDESYYLPMLEHLAKANTQATFHMEIKGDMLSDKVMSFLKTAPAHRFQFEIGIQSTNPPTLKAINRKDNWDRLASNIKELLDLGTIHIHTDLIAGLPYEGMQEFATSFNDVYSLGSDMLQLGFLKVLPGTQMAKETQQHLLVYMQEPPYEILSTRYMAYPELKLLKQLENVFEQTANTGYFPLTLQKLQENSKMDPFHFYIYLTSWWIKAGYYPQSHNAKGVAAILYQFIRESSLYTEAEQSQLLEALRYDIFLKLTGWYPDYLSWQSEAIFEATSAFWRNEELAKRYVPSYKFSSWRQIHKNYPIERFGNRYLLIDMSEAKPKLVELPSKIFQ